MIRKTDMTIPSFYSTKKKSTAPQSSSSMDFNETGQDSLKIREAEQANDWIRGEGNGSGNLIGHN